MKKYLIIIALLYLFTRLYHLTILPIFFDEANYIFWAKKIAETNQHWFLPLSAGKPVPFIWAIVFFLKIFPKQEYLLAGRLPSVFFGLVTLLGIYQLGKFVFGRKVGIAAAFLYALSPFALFHDRMALYDGMLSAMLIWTVYYVFKKNAVLWGLFLGLALLSKASALAYEILTPVAYLILNNFKKISLILIAFVISQIVANVQIVSKGYFDYLKKSMDYTSGGDSFLNNLLLSIDWLSIYLTPAIFGPAIFSLVILLWKKRRVGMTFIVLGIVPIIGFSFIGRVYFPRYLVFTLPFFLISLAFLLNELSRKTKIIFLILPIIFSQAIKFDWFLLTSPEKAPFPKIDNWQYVTGSPSGYGFEDMFQQIDKEIKEQKIVLVIESEYFGNELSTTSIRYFNNPNIKIIRRWSNVNVDKEIIFQAKNPLYYLASEYALNSKSHPKLKFAMEKIAESKKPGGEKAIYLFKIRT